MKNFHLKFRPGIYAIAMVLLNLLTVYAQTVTEYISFDQYTSATDNDFVNNFNNGTGLNQITTSGITGGCLTTPNTVSWGNDNAIYCSKYLNAPGNTSVTRLAFRYDTTQILSISYERAASIFLRPSVDFNHYVIASITWDSKLQIVSYSWANNMPVLNLQHFHWYELILTTDVISSNPTWQVNVNAQVNDLGLSGQLPPVPTGNSSGTFSDSIFAADPAVEVSFTATRWGGAKFVDDFRFQGVKSADSCTATSIETIQPEKDVIVGQDYITIKNCKYNSTVFLFDTKGQQVFSGKGSGNDFTFETTRYDPGIYFLYIGSKQPVVLKTAILHSK